MPKVRGINKQMISGLAVGEECREKFDKIYNRLGASNSAIVFRTMVDFIYEGLNNNEITISLENTTWNKKFQLK